MSDKIKSSKDNVISLTSRMKEAALEPIEEQEYSIKELIEKGLKALRETALEDSTKGFIAIVFDDEQDKLTSFHVGELSLLDTIGALEATKTDFLKPNINPVTEPSTESTAAYVITDTIFELDKEEDDD